MIPIISRIIHKDRYVLGIFLIVIAICYGNVIRGPLLFDDEHFIEKNIMVHSLGNIPDIYASSVTAGAFLGGNFYRPNQQLIYAVIYHFFKDSPEPYHIISILFHLFNTFLLFLLLLRFDFSRISAFVASLVFLIHPVQTESVSYISGLAGPLGFFFTLTALLLFDRSMNIKEIRKRWLLSVISILFFILALFSKENQVIFFPLSLLPVIYLFITKKQKPDRNVWITLLVYFLITAAYILLKFTVFRFTDAAGLTDMKNLYTENFWVRLVTFISVLWDYIKMIFFPLHLNYEKPYTAYATIGTWRFVFGVLLLAIAVFVTIRMRRYPRLFLGIAWFFIALMPFSGIIPLNAMFLEHWLYVPLAGAAIIVASVLEYLAPRRMFKSILVIAGVVVVLYGIRVVTRNAEWADIEKFYLNELKYTDSSIRIYNNLGMYYADQGNDEKCIYYYKKAIDAGDFYPQPHHNLANLYYKRGEAEAAIRQLYAALQIDPDFIYSLSKLYQIYNDLGRDEKAERVSRLIMNVQNGRRNNIKDIQDIVFN